MTDVDRLRRNRRLRQESRDESTWYGVRVRDWRTLALHWPGILTVTCPTTNEQVTLRRVQEIPDHDLPCPCGNPRHVAIGYEASS